MLKAITPAALMGISGCHGNTYLKSVHHYYFGVFAEAIFGWFVGHNKQQALLFFTPHCGAKRFIFSHARGDQDSKSMLLVT